MSITRLGLPRQCTGGDPPIDQLTLTDKILVISSTGYEGHLTQAVVDVKKGVIVSQSPVDVKMLNGTINANRLQVDDNGDLIRFDGGVTMILMPSTAQGDPKAAP